MVRVSVVIPAYNEALNLPTLHERLRVVAAGLHAYEFEFLFVDDGSTDRTSEVLSHLRGRDSRVRALRFSRNFGSHAACLAGLMEASGEVIVILAADLQDPPELIPEMLGKVEEGFEVVLGVRSRRDDGWLTVRLANIYHRLMQSYAISNWPLQGADVFMLTRQVAETVIRWRQKNTSIFAQILSVGFGQASVPYTRERRRSGRSKWTLARKIKLLIDSFVSFSFSPLRAISYSGMVFSALGLGYAGFIVAKKLAYGVPVQGWASLMVVLLVVSGFQLLMLGIIGEYLWRVADEVRGAPSFIIHSRLGIGNSAEPLADRWVPNTVQSRSEEREESMLERGLR